MGTRVSFTDNTGRTHYFGEFGSEESARKKVAEELRRHTTTQNVWESAHVWNNTVDEIIRRAVEAGQQ